MATYRLSKTRSVDDQYSIRNTQTGNREAMVWDHELGEKITSFLNGDTGWLNTREKLPPLNEWGNSQQVLAIVIGSIYEGTFQPSMHFEDMPQIGLGQYYKEGYWSVTGVSYIGRPVVSHWRPLPELPDAEEMRQAIVAVHEK